MNREKVFVKNTLIYMSGNLSSKLIIFLLLPIYTMYLTTEEYGYYDIIYTTVLLIVPIVSLQIYDAIYRFVLDIENDSILIKKNISNAIFLNIIVFLVIAPLLFILQWFVYIKYLHLIYIQIVVTCIFNLWQMIARALKKNNLFAVSGIIMTAVMLILNILFIVVLNFSVQALIVSNIIALATAIIYLENKLRIINKVSIKYIDKDLLKQLIIYSLPLIPNTISWWILNLSNRYIISFILGNEYNGIYAVASKFPSIVMMVNMIFNLAWQDTAIYEKDSSDRNIFYSKMFNYFLEIQLAILVIILPFIKIFTGVAIGTEFISASNYVPILILATFFQCFATFYNSFYIANKNTIGILNTTIIGALINIIITLTLIHKIGLYAAASANVFSSIIIVIIRSVYIGKKFSIKIKMNVMNIVKIIPILVTNFLFYYNGSVFSNSILFLLSIVYILILFKKQILKIIELLKIKLNNNSRYRMG